MFVYIYRRSGGESNREIVFVSFVRAKLCVCERERERDSRGWGPGRLVSTVAVACPWLSPSFFFPDGVSTCVLQCKMRMSLLHCKTQHFS